MLRKGGHLVVNLGTIMTYLLSQVRFGLAGDHMRIAGEKHSSSLFLFTAYIQMHSG